MRTRRTQGWMIGIAMILSFAASSCDSVPKDIELAMDAVSRMSAPRQLQHTPFAYYNPDCFPSDYVSFLFSEGGRRYWPIPYDGEDEERLRKSWLRPLPETVTLVPLEPTLEADWQLVLNFDDVERLLIVTAYTNPLKEPVAERAWEFQVHAPDRVAAATAEVEDYPRDYYRSF